MWMYDTSDPQIPHAAMRTTTSRGPEATGSTSSRRTSFGHEPGPVSSIGPLSDSASSTSDNGAPRTLWDATNPVATLLAPPAGAPPATAWKRTSKCASLTVTHGSARTGVGRASRSGRCWGKCEASAGFPAPLSVTGTNRDCRRIAGELALLGHTIATSTVWTIPRKAGSACERNGQHLFLWQTFSRQ